MDTQARWTLKRSRRRPARKRHEQAQRELVIPAFGDKNHLRIDRRHGFIRSFPVTDAHDGRRLGRLLGRLLEPHNTACPVWADSADRAAAKVALLVRRGLGLSFEAETARPADAAAHRPGNVSRARVWSRSSTSSPRRSAASAW